MSQFIVHDGEKRNYKNKNKTNKLKVLKVYSVVYHKLNTTNLITIQKPLLTLEGREQKCFKQSNTKLNSLTC